MKPNTIKVSKHANKNWRNNAIQFPRLIAEMQAVGAFSDRETMGRLSEEMDLSHGELYELVSRAQNAWDEIKANT